MPPPFGLPPLRVDHARLSRSVGDFAWLLLVLAAARFHPSSVFCLFRAAARVITLRRLCIWRVAPMVGVAPTRRGARCPRSRFRSRGPNSPRLPPGYARRAVVATLRFCRLPPAPGNSRHAPWALRPQAARGGGSSRGRFGRRRLGRASARALLSLGGLPLLSVACRLWGAPGFAMLRSGHPIGLLPCGRPPRARRGRRTPLSSRRRPKRLIPLEPLSPHAACARTRPRFARPLPRFPWAGSAWLARSGREPFRLTGITL